MNRPRSEAPYDNIHLAEIYDQNETYTHDVEFILDIINSMPTVPPPRILEPFCGTGRILLPLARAGYEITGIDSAGSMLDLLREKLAALDPSIQGLVTLLRANALTAQWPTGFDLVILGGNCMYELATPQEQRGVIEKAYQSLNPGGIVFVDNDNMEGSLDESWCNTGVETKSFPSGVCPHGIRLQGYTKPVWVDRQQRLWRAERRLELRHPDGKTEEAAWVQQKHPISADEVRSWLKEAGFRIKGVYGGTNARAEFASGDRRATFVAKRG